MNIEELQEKTQAFVKHINSVKQKIQDDLDKYLLENLNSEQIELDINIKGESKRKEVILQMLEIVPQSVLDFIKKRNCIIEIVKTRKELYLINGEAYKEDKDTDGLLGTCLTGYMYRIAILDLDLYTLEDTEDYNDGINYEMAQIFLHELGHLIDNCKPYSYASKTPTFLAIYNKEKDYVYVEVGNYEYATSDSTEYFASMFCEYITRPALLKIVAPKTYEFMKQYIEKL